jgi:hypothetical protein
MLLKMNKITASILFLAFLLEGCKVFNPAMPVENYRYQIPKPQSSLINLYADLEVAKLEHLLNSQIDSVLYNDTSFDDHNNDNLMCKAWKDGTIRLNFEKNQLLWELPVRLQMKKGIKIFNYNVPYVDGWEYSGNLILRFKTSLTINPDWSIKTKTITDDYQWVKKPAVKIGSTSLPITLIANLILSANKDDLSKQIDEVIAQSFDFKGYAQKGWKMLYNPLKLEGDYNAWLSINPTSVSMMPVEGSLGHIRFASAITSNVECLLDKTPQSPYVRPLPEIQRLSSASDTFHVNLLTDIPYSSINRIMSESIGDSTFTFGNRKLTFESFRVYGSNGKMAVETKVKGSLNGTLYLTGIPYFNAADTTVRIKDLAFDMKTKSLLMTSAKWIFNAKIERTISKSIAIPFNSNVSEIENQLATSIKHRPLGFGFELNGKLNRLTVSELILAPESVKANIVFSGNLSFGISEASLKQ